MKIQKTKRSAKKMSMLVVASILVALAGIAAAYFFYKHSSSTSQQPTSATSDVTDTTNSSSDDSATSNQTKDRDEHLSDSESTSDLSADNISLTISKSSSEVTITGNITAFSGSGTCKLRLTKGSSAVAKSATIIYQPEYSTCAGFSINRSELSPGTWNVTLVVESSDKTYTKNGELTLD